MVDVVVSMPLREDQLQGVQSASVPLAPKFAPVVVFRRRRRRRNRRSSRTRRRRRRRHRRRRR